MKIVKLRTEYKVNPIGIEGVPRFSWETQSEKRGCKQLKYQIRCAENLQDLEEGIDLLWDTKEVKSDESVHVLYGGDELHSGQRVYWKVKIWNEEGEESPWSETAFWQMGLIDKSEWKAKWIETTIEEDVSRSTACHYFRKEFEANQKIAHATVYVTCRGLYELRINGNKVSSDVFAPGWTSYHERLQYQAYDVTETLKQGRNALGVILGDGWYRGYLVWEGNKNTYGEKLAVLCQLEITYADGTKEIVVSNADWSSSTGPILKSDIYNGETYDARLEKTGWDESGYGEPGWLPVAEKDYGYENIVCSEGVPVKVTETIKPIEKIITPKGEQVFDLGQNMVGWVRFRLKGDKGAKITLNHAEVLDQDGNFYVENLRGIAAEENYFFKGGGEVETYEPRFTFHGFRYIKITNYEGEITLNDIEGRVVHSDMPPVGNFECSDPLVNRLQKNLQWGLRGNFLDVPTDCPQRDERLGWTGDAQVFAPTACFNVDASGFYRKWMKDFIVDQKEDGSVPWVVPNVVENGGGTGWSDGYGATGWADAAVIIPWQVYMSYGDVRILSEQYASMKAWEEYMIREAGETYIFQSGFHFGDWLSFAEYYSYNYNAPDYGYAGAYTEKELVATAYYYHTTDLMLKISRLLGKSNDAKKYEQLLPKIRNAFCNEFMTATGRLTSNTQTAYILALSYGLLPEDKIEIAAKRLADDINYFGHLTTGFLGTPLICEALTKFGYPEVAYKLLFNKRYPSWLYPVTMGATTIWERWDGIRPDGTFQTVGMNSFNHYAYGAVGNWLYTSVAGLNLDSEIPAYKKIIIKPSLTSELTYAKATHHSVYGEIVSHWEVVGHEVKLNVSVPPNTTAMVYIPCANPVEISESGAELKGAEGVRIESGDENNTVVALLSGKYSFKFPSPL